MSDKAKRIGDFLTLLHEMNCNKVSGDSAVTEVFGEGQPFAVVCNKCGGMDIEIIGERGIDYGGETGYSPGSTVIKCNGCGAAVTAWE